MTIQTIKFLLYFNYIKLGKRLYITVNKVHILVYLFWLTSLAFIFLLAGRLSMNFLEEKVKSNGVSPVSVPGVHPSDWVQCDLFCKWMKHFATYVKTYSRRPSCIGPWWPLLAHEEPGRDQICQRTKHNGLCVSSQYP